MEPQPNQRALAQVVANALTEANLTQRDAAERTGIALATLNRRLTGTSAFLVTELSLLARLVDLPTSALLAKAEDAAA